MRRMICYSLLAGGLWLAQGVAPVQGAEPAKAFLQKLREAQYFDTALEYLEVLEKSPLAPAEYKGPTLFYEKGSLLIDASRVTRDPAIRSKQLDEAYGYLDRFVKSTDANNPLASTAKKQLGNLMVERARIIVDRAKKANDANGLKQAAGLYEDAYKSYRKTQDEIATRLKSLPKSIDERKDPKLAELRDTLQVDYLETLLLAAAILEEKADTLPAGSKEQKDALTQAGKEYGEIYEKYRTRLAGMYARLHQGRTYQKLGNHKEALSYFDELLEEPDGAEEVRTLKTKVLAHAVTSLIAEKKYAEAILKGGGWVDKIRPKDEREKDWLELRLGVARAMKLNAEAIKSKDAKQAEGQLNQARNLAKAVAKYPSEYQKEARQLLTELGVESTSTEEIQPKSFNEAFTAGQEALDNVRVSQQILQAVPARLKVEKDPNEQQELKKQLEEAQQGIAKSQSEARRLFRAALALRDAETDPTRVNLVYYYLCYLNYLDGNYYDSALIGEFAARRYPDSPAARQCAKIAMAAYVKLYADEHKALLEAGTKADEILPLIQFEADKVVNICEYITTQWPDQPEATEALNTLIPFMIQTKQLAKAEAYLDRIPADSPNRGSAELKTGQAMWAAYVTGMNKVRAWKADPTTMDEGTDLAATEKELTDLRARAEKTLADGVARMKKSGATNPTFAVAVLSLAQIYVDTNQPAKAVAELTDPKVGTLTLVRANDPSVSREGMAEETLKVALRAYIGSLQTGGADASKALTEAMRVIDELKKVVGEGEKAQENLVRIYVSIARDLKAQIDLADEKSKDALSKGFETFLAQVGKEANDFQLQNWVGETFYNMGEAFDTNKAALTPKAKTYFTRASEMFSKMAERAKSDKNWVDPKIAIQLQLRSASCKRRLGDYEGAIKDFEAILLENPMMVNVQMEAAQTFQDWGEKAKDPKYYFRAIMGGDNKAPGKPEKIIWGWGSISRKTATAEAFRNIFFESRYNLAICRYRMGKLEKDPAKSKDLVEGALRDIRNISIVDKEYGGEEWRGKFDNLAKQIQRDLKQQAEGLRAFDREIKPVSNK